MKQETNSRLRKKSVFKANWMEKWFLFLSAVDLEVLKKCPGEKQKYTAIGATLLVPFLFGMIAACYAIWSVSGNLFIAITFALVWGGIILTIDRALLATYKHFATGVQKLFQFGLRFSVALLMGLTISHPLTLFIFQTEINNQLDKEKYAEIKNIRAEAGLQKQKIEDRINSRNNSIGNLTEKRELAWSGKGLLAMPNQLSDFDTLNSTFLDIDRQINDLKVERDRVQKELAKFQETYDQEVSGVRSGVAGEGPLARQILRDDIIPRNKELQRIRRDLSTLTGERSRISVSLVEDRVELEKQRQQIAKQGLNDFKATQRQRVNVINQKIAEVESEIVQLKKNLADLDVETQARVASRSNAKSDLMARSRVLHHLFGSEEGGGFARSAYIVLICLFTLVDTIPLIVKFFSSASEYDYLVKVRDQVAERSEFEEPSEFVLRMDERELEFEKEVEFWENRIDKRKHLHRLQIDLIQQHNRLYKKWRSHQSELANEGIDLAPLPALNFSELEPLTQQLDREIELYNRKRRMEMEAEIGAARSRLNSEQLSEFYKSEIERSKYSDLDTDNYFQGYLRFQNNRFFNPNSAHPNRYVVIDMSADQAEESARFLLQQLAKGKQRISLWGAYWDKKSCGKFNDVSANAGIRHEQVDEMAASKTKSNSDAVSSEARSVRRLG